MPVPLPENKDRRLHLELEFDGFERTGMAVAPKVADQPLVASFVGSRSPRCVIRYARGANDRQIGAHAFDEAYEAVVKNIDLIRQRTSPDWKFRGPNTSAPFSDLQACHPSCRRVKCI